LLPLCPQAGAAEKQFPIESDHLGPALGGDTRKLLLDHPQDDGDPVRLPDLAPMGVGLESVVSHRDLSLVGDVGRRPGDELQILHPLELRSIWTMPVTDTALALQEGEPLQNERGPDHVLSDPLGFGLRPGPDPAMDRETGVPPGEQTLSPFRAQQLPADKETQDHSPHSESLLAWHDGQNPRVRQENITSRSSPQSGHRIRAAIRSPRGAASVHEGKPAAGVAAVEVTLDRPLDNGPEIAIGEPR